MLIVTRKSREGVVVDDSVFVTVATCLDKGCVLEIQAPADVSIESDEDGEDLGFPDDVDADHDFLIYLEPSQTIRFSREVSLTLVDVKRATRKVRLGFDAPKTVPIIRREIYDDIARRQGDD